MSDSNHEDHLGKNLKAIRAALGWSQVRMAQASNVDQPSLSKLEHGRRVGGRAMLLHRLAHTFGVTADQLANEDLTGSAERVAKNVYQGEGAEPVADQHMDTKILANNILAFRAARGWSQMQTATGAGVAQAVVSRLERAEVHRPSHRTIARIADVFGVNVDRLLSEDLTAEAWSTAGEQPLDPPREQPRDPSPKTLDAAVFEAVTLRRFPVEVLDDSRVIARRFADYIPAANIDDAADAIVQAVRRLRDDGKPLDDVALLATIAFGLHAGNVVAQRRRRQYTRPGHIQGVRPDITPPASPESSACASPTPCGPPWEAA